MENKNIPVIIEQRVTEKIEHLCHRFFNNEWSGTVFYTCNTSIKNIKNFKITIHDIFLQGIGSVAYTESEFDEKIVEYMTKHPELLDMVKGIIHSHHNMKAYFSGTDINELIENCVHHNMYLSIVCNNNMDCVGKIYQRKYSMSAYAFDHNGDKYKVDNIQNNIIDYNVYDCNVIPEGVNVGLFPELDEQIDYINSKPKKGLKGRNRMDIKVEDDLFVHQQYDNKWYE